LGEDNVNKITSGLKKFFKFAMNKKVQVKIGLALTSFYTLITFAFAAVYYLIDSFDEAIFWAIMMVGSEVSFAGLRVLDSNLKKTNTYTTNVTLDMSKVNSPETVIESIRNQLKAKSK
jgi:hypothetical protein